MQPVPGTGLALASIMLFSSFSLCAQSGAVAEARPADTTFIIVLAEGAVRTALKPESGNPQGGTGSLGISVVRGGQFALTAKITVLQSLDTLREGFGAAILSPGTAKGLGASLALQTGITRGVAMRFNLGLAQSEWLDTASSRSSAAGVLGLRAMAVVDLARVAQDGTNLRVSMFAGPSLRLLFGDISTEGQFRQRLLGNDRRTFVGMGFGLALAIGGVVAEAELHAFPGSKVAGVTAGQVSAGLTVSTPILTLPVVPASHS